MSKSDLIEDLMEVIFLEFARSVIHLCIKIIKKNLPSNTYKMMMVTFYLIKAVKK